MIVHRNCSSRFTEPTRNHATNATGCASDNCHLTAKVEEITDRRYCCHVRALGRTMCRLIANTSLLARMVFTFGVPNQLRAIKVHIAQLSSGVPLRLIGEML